MSRYYPSRGIGRGRGNYYQSSYSRGGGGYYEGRGGNSGGGMSSGPGRYYPDRDRRESSSAASSAPATRRERGTSSAHVSYRPSLSASAVPGRYYSNRDKRESGSGMPSSHRTQLEIAKKLVDTLMQTSGGRRPSEHYGSGGGGGGGGEPPYKRPREDSYDRERSSSMRSRHSDYHYRRDEYPERRRHDEYHAPMRRPFRARGYAPRRGTGYVRGGPPRRPFGDYEDDEPRGRSFESHRDDAPRSYPPTKQLVTKCPHCHARCATFADFRKHQLGREHMAAMRRVLMKIRAELGKMRLAQREEQKELESKEAAKDPEEFENRPTQFCTLCRLQFKEVEGVVHNETEWHRKQRAYQNPSCKICNMTFPARIAYEKHSGTFTHIQKMNQSERRAERRDAADFQKGDFMTLDSVGDVDEEGEREEAAAGADDGEHRPRLTATQKLAELADYDGKHAVGSNYMRKTEVYHCGLCDIYIKITAKVNAVLIKHCMGKKHFENYRKKLVKLSEKEEEEKKAAAEAEGDAEDDAKEEGELPNTPKPNGMEEVAAPAATAVAETAREEPLPSRVDDAAWEQMDDNFLLGDDQEEEPEKRPTASAE